MALPVSGELSIKDIYDETQNAGLDQVTTAPRNLPLSYDDYSGKLSLRDLTKWEGGRPWSPIMDQNPPNKISEFYGAECLGRERFLTFLVTIVNDTGVDVILHNGQFAGNNELVNPLGIAVYDPDDDSVYGGLSMTTELNGVHSDETTPITGSRGYTQSTGVLTHNVLNSYVQFRVHAPYSNSWMRHTRLDFWLRESTDSGIYTGLENIAASDIELSIGSMHYNNSAGLSFVSPVTWDRSNAEVLFTDGTTNGWSMEKYDSNWTDRVSGPTTYYEFKEGNGSGIATPNSFPRVIKYCS